MKTKENLGAQHAIIQFCLCLFIVTFPFYLTRQTILSQSLFNQVLIIFIWGIGSIGIYIILGSLLKKCYREMIKEKQK
jgi:hypothetical protein